VEVQPGRMDELLGIARESVMPAARQQRGFRDALWLTDRDANKLMIVSLWETREDMEESERSGYYREQLGKFGGLLAGDDVVRETYEVGIQA
jgi:heme-degrading monooxygenase HmoA